MTLMKRVVLNPRAYLTPLLLVMVFHHLPMILAFALITRPARGNECDVLVDLMQWLDVAFGLHVALMVVSMATILTTLCLRVYRVRRPENWMVIILFALYAATLGWSIYGGSLTGDTLTCDFESDEIQNCADSISYFQHFDLVFSAVVFSLGVCSSYTCGVHTSEDRAAAERRWQKRCSMMFRMLTCKTYKARDQDDEIFASLGMLLGKVFVVQYSDKKYEGMQFNDLMFCLRLVAKQQGEERKRTMEQDMADVEATLAQQRLHPTVESSTLHDLAYYGRLANGIYGWPMYIWYSPFKWFKIFSCCKKPSEEQVVDHDNVVAGNRASFVHYTGIQEESLVYLNCYNFVFHAPYSIVKDSARKELIISVRGSLSFYDFVTDGLARIVPMEPNELPEDAPNPQSTRTHYGMLRTARSILTHLQQDSRKRIFWDFAMENCIKGDWNVVVCGHSMGAGVGGVLTLLLKRFFPSTRGYLYAPPMLFDPVTAHWSKSFMITAVYGDDLVPRLSIANVARLREEMANLFESVAHEPLYKVRYGRRKNPSAPKAKTNGSSSDEAPSSSDSNRTPLTEGSSNRSLDSESNLNFLRMPHPGDTQEVDVPGIIIHLQTVKKPRVCGCTVFLGEQELKYTIRDASYFHRIWITPRAISDHMLHHYDRNIRHLIDCMDLEPPPEDSRSAAMWVHHADESTPYKSLPDADRDLDESDWV